MRSRASNAGMADLLGDGTTLRVPDMPGKEAHVGRAPTHRQSTSGDPPLRLGASWSCATISWRDARLRTYAQ